MKVWMEERGAEGGRQMASERAHSSEARPVSLSSSTLSPTCCCLGHTSCPPTQRENTHTHSGTHGLWGFVQEKRFPERFLKVELLKAWKPVSALKLNGVSLCHAWHHPEWRQCLKCPTKADLKPLMFLEIDTFTAQRYRLHCAVALCAVCELPLYTSK